MQVEILDLAERDLVEGFAFYESQQEGLGEYFLNSLYSDIDSLAYFGGIHRRLFGMHRLLAHRFPYAVFYDIDDDCVRVIAVVACRRKPSWTGGHVRRGRRAKA